MSPLYDLLPAEYVCHITCTPPYVSFDARDVDDVLSTFISYLPYSSPSSIEIMLQDDEDLLQLTFFKAPNEMTWSWTATYTIYDIDVNEYGDQYSSNPLTRTCSMPVTFAGKLIDCTAICHHL